jgi:predicted ATPase
MNFGRSLIQNDRQKRKDLAIMNCEAAKRAIKLSAYFPAMDYLQVGLELLIGDDKDEAALCWIEEYDFTLEVRTLLAEACNCAGQHELLNEQFEQVTKHARTIEDGLRTYIVKLESLGAQNKLEEQVATTFRLLEQLGEKSKARPSKREGRLSLKRAINKLGKVSDESILALPIMFDIQKKAAIQVMTSLAMTLFHLGQTNLTRVFCYRSECLTLDYGLAPYSPLALELLVMLAISDLFDISFGYRVI